MQETHQTNSILKDIKDRDKKELPPFVIDEKKVTEKQDKLIQLLDKAKELEEQGKYIEALQIYNEYKAEVIDNPSIERAREILGKENVHDNLAIAKAFGLEQTQIPEPEPIPFSQEELEKAKEQGYMLVYRISETLDGVPLTPAKMHELAKTEKEKNNLVYDINNPNAWFNKTREDCIHKETPHQGWALVTKELIPDAREKNYLEQTKCIIDHLIEQYKNQAEIPPIIQQGIDEYMIKKDDLATRLEKMENNELTDKQIKELSIELANLIINKHFRRNTADVLFDLQIHKNDRDDNEELLKGSNHDFTNSLTSDGILVYLGFFASDGADVNYGWPCYRVPRLAVVVSRSHGTL